MIKSQCTNKNHLSNVFYILYFIPIKRNLSYLDVCESRGIKYQTRVKVQKRQACFETNAYIETFKTNSSILCISCPIRPLLSSGLLLLAKGEEGIRQSFIIILHVFTRICVLFGCFLFALWLILDCTL